MLLACNPYGRQGAVGKTGQVMFFLLRMGFWLTVILVCLPSGGSQSTPKVNVGPVEAISAATAAVSDCLLYTSSEPTRPY